MNRLPVSYTHLRAHETREDLVCRLLLEKKNARGAGLAYRRGQGKISGKHSSEGSKKASWSNRFNRGPRCLPEVRYGRDDLQRRAKLRLTYSKANLRRAKLQYTTYLVGIKTCVFLGTGVKTNFHDTS